MLKITFQVASEKITLLEHERDQLIKETELILKRADADSDELRETLAYKEHKLSDVNTELDKLRYFMYFIPIDQI